MMRWLRRWLDHERRHLQPRDPDEAIVEREKQRMQRDLRQVQRLEDFMLNRAVEEGLISAERAASIRLTSLSEDDEDVSRVMRAKLRMRMRMQED